MGINVFPAPSAETVVYGYPGAQSGTFALAAPLAYGVYFIETDTTQTYTLAFQNSTYNFKFTGTMRGGSGTIVAPYEVDQIVFPTGITFPIGVKITKLSVPMIGEITSPAFSWDNPKTTGDFTASAFPAGATGLGIWLNNGTFNSTSSASTSQANIPISAPPAANASGVPMLVAALGADGNYGVGTVFTTGAVPANSFTTSFTSSSTWLSPITGNIELLVVAGGGGGSYTNYAASGGGAGGGGVRYFSSYAVTAGTTYTVTVGNGGAGANPGGKGGNSAFGAISATGGGQGGGPNYGDSGYPGGSGGGGTGTGNSSWAGGYGASGNQGGYSPVEGYAGGNGQAGGPAGGGGGAGGAAPGNGNNAAGVGYTSSISGSSVTYSAGGTGGTGNGGTASGYGTGGAGGQYYNFQGQAGAKGIVVVKYTY